MTPSEKEHWLRRLQLERHLINLKAATSSLVAHVEADSKGQSMKNALNHAKARIKAADAILE